MGLTQVALGALGGLSHATVNQVESGTIKDTSLTRAARLLDVVGLSVAIATPRPRPASREDEKAKIRALDMAARKAQRQLQDADQLDPAARGFQLRHAGA